MRLNAYPTGEKHTISTFVDLAHLNAPFVRFCSFTGQYNHAVMAAV